jgi:predicted permease
MDDMISFLHDTRYALRLMWRAPVFTLIAIATLALGIGANTAIFSVVNAALIAPLPFPEADRLVAVWTTVRRQTVERRGTSYPDFRDFRERARAFDAIAAWSSDSVTLASSGDAAARQIQAELVSPSYLQMLGAAPAAGRLFTAAEDEENGSHAVALISYAFWQRQFGGKPEAIGSTVRLNDRAVTILGVLQRGFTGLSDDADLWMPMGLLDVSQPGRAKGLFQSRGARWHQTLAHLRPGVSMAQASADVSRVARELEQAYPDTNVNYGAAVFPLKDEIVGDLEPLLVTLLAAVAFILLIACVNLANLLLARASVRQRETAIRAALGADRARLLGQFFAEGILLSVLGAAAGLLLAMWSVDAIVAMSGQALPSFVHPHLDWRLLAFVTAITCLSALLLSTLPAVQGTRADLNDLLREGARGSAGGRRRTRLRSVLVIAEVALSLLLLIGAGLMIRTFLNVRSMNLGFHPEQVFTARVSLPPKYPTSRLPETVAELTARLGALPGVRRLAVGSDAPLDGNSSAVIVSPEGRATGSLDRGVRVYTHAVTPGFFDALGVPLLAGRDFDAHDTEGHSIAIVSRGFASKVWGDRAAIGRRFKFGRGDSKGPLIEVIGVAADLRYRSLIADPSRQPEDPDIYVPFAVQPDRSAAIVVRTTEDPGALASTIRQGLLAFDRDIALFRERTMSGLVSDRTSGIRVSAGMMTLFGGVALLLAAIGVYGLINYSVSQRRQEIGVRMALGAGRGEIYRLVLGDAVRLSATGIAIGLIAAVPAARLLRSQLYGVSPSDPLTYAGIVVLLMGVAVVSTLLPARRAARVDPMIALRAE